MEKYTYENYSLVMIDTGLLKDNKNIVKYELAGKDEGIIFEGKDYYPSPMFRDSEGAESASTLLAFLTLLEGDTDDDWFEDYTEKQIKFRDEVAELIGYDWIEKIYPGFHDAGM